MVHESAQGWAMTCLDYAHSVAIAYVISCLPYLFFLTRRLIGGYLVQTDVN